MFKFILQMLMMISFGGILYIIARALPRTEEEEKGSSETSPTPRIVVYLEQADERLLVVLEKALRRIRVVLLKLDNAVSQKLRRFKQGGNPEGILGEENRKEEK